MPILILIIFLILNVESKDSCLDLKKLKSEVPPNIYYGCVKENCNSNCAQKEICSCQCLVYGCLERSANSQSRAVASYQAIKNKNNTISCVSRAKYQHFMAKTQKCKN